MEELIPIARYVQARYLPSFRYQVRWINGPQSHDAIFYAPDDLVEREICPAETHLEMTTAVHPNDYLAREESYKQGFTFGPNDIARNMRTRAIKSEAFV